jgi:TolA-binding protein
VIRQSTIFFLIFLTAGVGRAADGLVVARSALADKLYGLAERQAKTLVDTAETVAARADALLVYVQALAEQGRNEDVLKTLNAHVATLTESTVGVFAYWRARALLGSGDPAGARAAAEGGLAADPQSADATALRRLVAQACLALNDSPGALRVYAELDTAVTNVGLRAAVLYEWAQALDGLGRATNAVEVLARQPREPITDPFVENGILLHAAILARLDRQSDAMRVLQMLVTHEQASESGRVRALVELARLQIAGGKTDDAVVSAHAAAEAALRTDLRLAAGIRLADILLCATNTLDEGETRIKALIREFPESLEARNAQMRLANALAAAGLHERAAAAYRVYIESFGETGAGLEALAGRARSLFQIKSYGEAANLYQKLHDTTTNELRKAEYLYRAADAVAADGRFKQAAKLYRSVNQLYGKSALAPRALFQSADALDRDGDLAAAEGAFRQTAERYAGAPLAEQAWLRLAALLSARTAVNAAVEAYGAVLAVTTNPAVRSEALIGRGIANFRAYRREAALQDFTDAAVIPDPRGEAYYWQVMSLFSLKRDDESYRAGESFLDQFPEAPRLPDMLLWLAKYDYNHGRFENARKRFLLYVERWPKGPWSDFALLWAGRAAFHLNDLAQTVELMARLWKTYPSSQRLAEARFVQADALCELRRFDEAVLLFSEVITRYPESDWGTPAWGRKGDSYLLMGGDDPKRFQEAMDAYREMLGRRDVTPSMALQAEYKIGRCLEKLTRTNEAIEHYYERVVVPFLDDRAKGRIDDESAVWFTLAAFNAADLLIQTGKTAAAARVLRRVADTDLPGQAEARQRLERLERTRP